MRKCIIFISGPITVENRQKSSLKESVFINSALKLQCHIAKNALLQTALLAILPTGNAFVFVVVVATLQSERNKWKK